MPNTSGALSVNDFYSGAPVAAVADNTPPAAAALPDNGAMSVDDFYGKPSFLQEQANNIANAGKAVWNMAGEAGQGIVNALSHPLDTASDIGSALANTSPADIASGVERAVRSTPIVGPLFNKATGVTPEQQKDIDAADAEHQTQHPLTDFLQKSAPMLMMPGGVGKQIAALAGDTFLRSKQGGKSYADATHDALNTAILASTFLGAGKYAPAAAGAVGKGVAKEFGVSGDAIDRYLADPAAVNDAAQYVGNPEGLKSAVDEQVAPINQAVDQAQTSLGAAQDAVAATKAAPVGLAAEIPASLDTQGEKLKGMSDKAFDILDQEGQTFPVAKLQQAVTDKMDSLKIGGEVEPSVGPDAAAYGLMGRFNELLNQVGDKVGTDVPAPVVKELIQQLDDLSAESYSTNAGALSPVAAGKLAQVRYTFNQMLRQASPAYADAMDQLAPQVGLVNDLSRVFGNDQKAMTALGAAANPTSPRGYVIRQMLDQYDQANGTDFLKQVQDYYDAPKANLQNAKDTLATAQTAAGQVSKLGPNSTEGVIKSIQGGRNIEAQNQLGALNPDLLQQVQDVGTAGQFARPTTNGSRKTVVGGLIGGAAGHLAGAAMGAPELGKYVGGAVGGATGFLADKYGGQAVKTALDAGIKLGKVVDTPFIAPLMKAAAAGPKSLAVVHYMLNQTNPEYQQLTQDGP